MPTPNTGIPYVPENTLDPAAGLNLSLNVVDALLQTAALDMDRTTPPASPSDGDLHLVAAGASGAWAGHDHALARYVAVSASWQFYAAGVSAHLVLNKADGALYAWNGSAWVAPIAGGSVAASAVSYSNATSGLVATNVQDAVDELKQAVDDVGDIDVLTVAVPALDIAAGVVTVDCAASNLFTLLLDENVSAINFTNLPTAGRGQAIAIRIRQDGTGGRTVAWPASFKALGGSDTAVPTAANAYAVLSLTTFDAGTRWEYALQEAGA